MPARIDIALVGDFDASVLAHRAIPRALSLAADDLALSVTPEWVSTEEIHDESRVAQFDGIWCVPASPYRSMGGALRAIQFARENGRPFLGTCGGFQHAVVEYARNVLGWADAEHAEMSPDATRQVIALLACSLVEVTGTIHFRVGSRIAAAYGCLEAAEGYHCNYGLNPAFRKELVSGQLQIGAEDTAGDVRAVELEGHPFYVATLFQPERAALRGETASLVRAFVQAAAIAHTGD